MRQWWANFEHWVYGDRELSQFPRAELKRLRRTIGRVIFRNPRRWVLGLLMMGVAAAQMVVVLSHGPKSLVILLSLSLSSSAIVLIWYDRRLRRRELKRMLLACEIHLAYCMDCGYDLRGSTSATCPECGCLVVDVAD